MFRKLQVIAAIQFFGLIKLVRVLMAHHTLKKQINKKTKYCFG